MNDISIIYSANELRTDSRDLASLLDHRHRTIIENIDKYHSELLDLGPLPFQTEKGIALPQGGFAKETRFSMLNEDQCYFVLTLMRNNAHVVKSKLQLVKAFRDARSQLAMRDIARVDGKQVRNLETKAIADLVEYAKAKGSKSAETYYSNITKMTNALLGIKAGERDKLDARTLGDIAVMEKIVANAVSDGINAGLEYKDIFQLAKNRCKLALPAIGVK
jgi:phage regulator Rha-like protein